MGTANKFKILNFKFKTDGVFKITSVGRITLSKDYETLIKATERLKENGLNFRVEIAGQPATKGDLAYLEHLKEIIKNKNLADIFKFIGPIANKNLPPFLQSANLFVNMSHTGSLDKAILEAMACGLPVLTCNEALKNVLGNYADRFMYPKKDDKVLAEKISLIISLSAGEVEFISADMRKIVVENHGLDKFIDKLASVLS